MVFDYILLFFLPLITFYHFSYLWLHFIIFPTFDYVEYQISYLWLHFIIFPSFDYVEYQSFYLWLHWVSENLGEHWLGHRCSSHCPPRRPTGNFNYLISSHCPSIYVIEENILADKCCIILNLNEWRSTTTWEHCPNLNCQGWYCLVLFSQERHFNPLHWRIIDHAGTLRTHTFQRFLMLAKSNWLWVFFYEICKK